jgi:DNA/RNA-binding domain of Phe-tRNA-synthetase-like protein
MRQTLNIKIDFQLKTSFLGLTVLTCNVNDVKVEKQNFELEKFKDEITKKIREKYDLDSIKKLPIFRAYRDFFWRVGIDPAKNRPAAEALIRRILGGRTIPHINTLVDAYNLASIKTEIALAAFDANKLKGDLLMRFAKKGEIFLGIGMEKPILLKGGEIVVSDREKLVVIYPYRDADTTKITEKTKNVIVLVCGVPGIGEETLQNAAEVALQYITGFCDGDGKIKFSTNTHKQRE